MSRKKKNILLLLVGVCVIGNVVWGLNYLNYCKLTSEYIKCDKATFYKNDEDLTYFVKRPDYCSFTGSYTITNNNSISVIIWPEVSFCKKYEIGVEFYDDVEKHIYRFYIDEQLNLVNTSENRFTFEQEETVKKMIAENKEELQKMYQLAESEWKFS